MTGPAGTSLAFDIAGRLTRSAGAFGTRLLSYDPAGRLATVSLGLPGSGSLTAYAAQRLGYDGWERLASISTTAADPAYSASDIYTYDAAGRISTWNRTGFGAGSAAYGFDPAGNLTSKVTTVSTTYAYNAANQLTTETAGSIVTTHTYDEFGRLSRSTAPSGETTYTYDGLGKLAQISRAGASAEYAYGVSGMREAKSVTVAGVTKTTKSVWSGMTLVAEKDSDETTYEYIFGGGVPLELVVTSAGGGVARYGYQTDAAGSVIGITDEAGAVIARYAYDPYGVPTCVWGASPIASRNPLRYRGYYYDHETGLYYLPARYYEPRSARFLSVDPAAPEAGDPTSLNRYAYCFGDPVNASDPTGAITDVEAESWRHYSSTFAGDRSSAKSANRRFRKGMNWRRSRNAKRRAQGRKVIATQTLYEEGLKYRQRSNLHINLEAAGAALAADAVALALAAPVAASLSAAAPCAALTALVTGIGHAGTTVGAAGVLASATRLAYSDPEHSVGAFATDAALFAAGQSIAYGTSTLARSLEPAMSVTPSTALGGAHVLTAPASVGIETLGLE